jgi:hypothetical protein
MAVYTASNGTLLADIAALTAIASTSLPVSGSVLLFVIAENNWFEYKSSLTSGDVRPVDNPATGYWIRIGREKLFANRTYHLSTTGSDSNNGLGIGTPFLTWSKTQAAIASIDCNGFEVTVQFADGTYTTPIVIDKQFVGLTRLTLQGNTTTPSNCLISVTGAAISVILQQNILVKGFKLVGSTYCLYGENTQLLTFTSLDFGAATFHIYGVSTKIEFFGGSYTVSGGAVFHVLLDNGLLNLSSSTITFSGSPVIAYIFYLNIGAYVNLTSLTFSGNASGSRYICDGGSILKGVSVANTIANTTTGSTANGGVAY